MMRLIDYWFSYRHRLPLRVVDCPSEGGQDNIGIATELAAAIDSGFSGVFDRRHRRPYLGFRLVVSQRDVQTPWTVGLVDTGSDITVMHGDWATEFQIRLELGDGPRPVGGLFGGVAYGYDGRVDIQIAHGPILSRSRIRFVDIAGLGHADAIQPVGFSVLGWQGFFRYFSRLGFDVTADGACDAVYGTMHRPGTPSGGHAPCPPRPR